jgi:pyruvate formate lyase activating enzyme
MKETMGNIFNIQKFSIHDGPGIRTTVFLKGCNLSCSWCHNPEGISFQRHMIWYDEKCAGCRSCERSCLQRAICFQERKMMFDPAKCIGCNVCVEKCSHRALTLWGRVMTVAQVIMEVEKDEIFYKSSGGGVTVSGGEPLCQSRFVKELFEECKKKGYHTTLETSGYVNWESLEEVVDVCDLFLYDLKAFQSDLHKKGTGKENEGIKENLKRLAERKAEIMVRTPVIPGFNDAEEEIEAIFNFVNTLSEDIEMELLPYHNMSSSKYSRLEKEWVDFKPPSPEKMERLNEIIKKRKER